MRVKFTYRDGSEETIDGVLSNSVVMDAHDARRGRERSQKHRKETPHRTPQ